MATVSFLDAVNMAEDVEINEHRKGGTYLKFSVYSVHLPLNVKKEWKVAWFALREKYKDSRGSERTVVEAIFKESPFQFLSNIMKLEAREVLEYRGYENEHVVSCQEIYFCERTFRSEKMKALPSDKARKFFSKVLATIGTRDPLLNNRRLLGECCKSTNAGLQESANKFSLESFYFERIGDAVGLDELPWDKIQLSKSDILLSDVSEEAMASPASIESLNALVEAFRA